MLKFSVTKEQEKVIIKKINQSSLELRVNVDSGFLKEHSELNLTLLLKTNTAFNTKVLDKNLTIRTPFS